MRCNFHVVSMAISLAACAGEVDSDGADERSAEEDSSLTSCASCVLVSAERDTYVRSGSYANENYGQNIVLRVDADSDRFGNTEEWSLVSFRVPADVEVAGARLRLYVVDASPNAADVYAVADPWATTSSLTWNQRPGLPSEPIASLQRASSSSWVDIDVSAGVRAGDVAAFVLVPRSSNGVHFSSRESTTNKPLLVVELGAGSAPDAGTVIDAAQPMLPPGSGSYGVNLWPCGHHTSQFALRNDSIVTTTGCWDPARASTQQPEKDKMISEFFTAAGHRHNVYSVGLPMGNEPTAAAGYRAWSTSGVSGTVTGAKLGAAGFPTVTLTDKDGKALPGPIYLIDGWTNCPADSSNGCDNFNLGVGKFAIVNSGFGSIIAGDGAAEVWIVNSLVDTSIETQTALKCEDCTRLVIAYSELLGGDDAMKLNHNTTLYRSHLHGMWDGPPLDDPHNDGVQAGGVMSNFFAIENQVDLFWQEDNGGFWLACHAGNCGPAYMYRNLLWGGQDGIRVLRKTEGCVGTDCAWVGPAVAKDNVFAMTATVSSFGGPDSGPDFNPFSSFDPDPYPGYMSGSRRIDGVIIAEGYAEPTAEHDRLVQEKIDDTDRWVAQIRKAAGLPTQ